MNRRGRRGVTLDEAAIQHAEMSDWRCSEPHQAPVVALLPQALVERLIALICVGRRGVVSVGGIAVTLPR